MSSCPRGGLAGVAGDTGGGADVAVALAEVWSPVTNALLWSPPVAVAPMPSAADDAPIRPIYLAFPHFSLPS